MSSYPSLDISEARKQFTKIDDRVNQAGCLWITRHNKRAFAIVSVESLETIEATMQILKDPKATELLIESLRELHEGKTQ